jgi:hypothetical protein
MSDSFISEVAVGAWLVHRADRRPELVQVAAESVELPDDDRVAIAERFQHRLSGEASRSDGLIPSGRRVAPPPLAARPWVPRGTSPRGA